MSEAGAVDFGGGNDVRLEEIFLAGQFEFRELGTGACLGEAGFECGEFTGARAFLQVGEAGLRGAKLIGGLALGGEILAAFEGEERGVGGDPRAFDDRERFQSASQRRGNVDEVTLEIALPAGRGRAGASGEREESKRGGGKREEVAAHAE